MALLLVAASEVFEAMGQNPDLMEESIPAVESAILRSTIKLETVLKTKLRPETRRDTFHISGVDGGPLNNRYTLLLTNGCVQLDAGVTVSIVDELSGITSSNSYVIQPEQGKVILSNLPDDLLGKTIAITYTSGFDSAESTPDEIKQAILCYVPLMLLSASQPGADPKANAVAVPKATSLDSVGTDMVYTYFRRQGNAIKPLASTLVE